MNQTQGKCGTCGRIDSAHLNWCAKDRQIANLTAERDQLATDLANALAHVEELEEIKGKFIRNRTEKAEAERDQLAAQVAALLDTPLHCDGCGDEGCGGTGLANIPPRSARYLAADLVVTIIEREKRLPTDEIDQWRKACEVK